MKDETVDKIIKYIADRIERHGKDECRNTPTYNGAFLAGERQVIEDILEIMGDENKRLMEKLGVKK